MIKRGNWIGDSTPNSTISGPEVTKVTVAPGHEFNGKKSLSSNGWELEQISGRQIMPIYFQFLPWANPPSGSFHQELTIDLLCWQI